MRVELEKLLSNDRNKYIFCRAAMQAVEKVGNMKSFRDNEDKDEKIVITTLNYLLDEKIKYIHNFKKE